MKKTIIRVTIVLIALLSFILVNNTVDFAPEKNRKVRLLAHRGLAQTFDIETVKWNTNTAAIIHKPEHPYIENTIPSMRVAFDYGADIVEFDIRVSKDKELVVFHDETVDFRTEMKGRVSDFTVQELKRMDVGYGYTHDNGQTFPLRGTGVGMMPTFDEVVSTFPDKELLVHIRDDGEEIGEILLDRLDRMDGASVGRLSVYGNDKAIDRIKQKYPRMKSLSARSIKKAFLDYALIGWTGIVPKSMRNMEIHMPIEYAKYMWGWPGILIRRLDSVNTRFVLTKKKGQWSGAFDSEQDLAEIPEKYHGYIWTERIDRISGILRSP